MRKDLTTSLVAVIVLTVFLGVIYPLAITGIAQVVFPGKANGSKVSQNGKVVGSSLIAQSFSKPVIGKNGKPKVDSDGNPVLAPDPKYFQPRPSATGYAPDATYFANLGPNSKDARDEVKTNLAAYMSLERPYDHALTKDRVPVDAVVESASGVDPHISQANAWIQAHRIAALRHLSVSKVDSLISNHTDGRFLGLLGEPGVNVLQLNIALNQEAPTK